MSPAQSAFILGRAIHDDILLTQEIIHKFNLKGKSVWVTLKLDMKKAYDQLEWNFFQSCLQQLGFLATWNKWIME